jgi:DNA-binding CsgD family transcriptional regulator
LVPLTGLWWLVLVFGVLIPLALATIGRWGTPSIASNRKGQESVLLKALARGDEVTPVTVAMRTSLTVDEASKGLEGLARNGHLKFRADDGAFVYSLRPQDRQGPSDSRVGSVEPQTELEGPLRRRLEEPLSGRELEVLTLLATGRTNAEIARDLFIAVGTVKAHINNIYRKLDARNRAEALNRARELKVLN